MKDDAPAPSARARVRAELTREIKDIARRHLDRDGSAGLSLRAVARELGMVSSAVYRYFPSRDELLTALIIDAYTAVGEYAAQAEAAVRRTDLAGRWLAICRAVRQWAVSNPAEYSLIFGTPVPGYRAPVDTVDPALRMPLLLLAILDDAVTAGCELGAEPIPIPRPVRADLKRMREAVAPNLDDRLLARGLMAWAQLIGMVSFELFGHLHNGITDYPAHFEYQMRTVARELGLV